MPYISGGGATVELDVVLTEQVSRGGKVTSSPIEGNKTISDHFSKNQDVVSITGVCTTNAANKIANLSALYNNATLCRYVGRNGISNAIISKLDTDHGSSYDAAFSFRMQLTLVQISSTQEFKQSTGLTNGQNAAQVNQQTNIGAASPTTKEVDAKTSDMANSLAASSISQGDIYYIVKSGDTLYAIGLKYNVSWPSIASLNNISSPYTIYPGQKLLIKKGT